MIRSILLIALLFSADAFADPLRIVMRTKDRLVVEYRCLNTQDWLVQNVPVMRTDVRQHGYVMWYVVGGVPPYTIVESDGHLDGRVCVTVVDAMGQVATASGSFNTLVDLVTQECPPSDPGPRTGKDNGHYTRRIDRYAAYDGRYRSPATPQPRDPSTTRSKPGPTTTGDGPRVTYGGTSSKGPDRPTGMTGYRQASGK